jgi:hypothetical protein
MTDSDSVTVRAVRAVVSGGKLHEAGATFTTSAASASQALAFGLVERVEAERKSKPSVKRTSASSRKAR